MLHRLAPRLRALIATAVTATAVLAATLAAPSAAHAAPGPFQPLNIPGVCNPASWALAQQIDKTLAAANDPTRMIQAGQPKPGETGYVDGTVAYAMDQLATLLGKKIGEITAADIANANNAKQVAQAIANALDFRKNKKMGDFTLTYVDKAGNNVYLWCLAAVPKVHDGPDLGLLYVPAGKKQAAGSWIAGCLLAGGLNDYKVSFDAVTGNFSKFEWINQGPLPVVPGQAPTFKRYFFQYDAVKNVLNITKTVGSYDDAGKFVPDPKQTVEEQNPGAPPADFSGLKLNGTQISLGNGGGCGCPAEPVVLAAADPANPGMLDFTNPPMTGSGTAADPYVGIDPIIEPGDTFLVTAPDGTIVTAPGSDPDWQLLTSGDSTVLFRYDGAGPLDIGVGQVIPDVAVLGPAPSSSGPSPSSSPSPSFSPSSSPSPSLSPSPSPTPSFSPPTSPSASPSALG